MRPKRSIHDLAITGGQPVFDNKRHVGQLNLPDWDKFVSSMEGIFNRRFFANNGPLVQELENRLAEYLNVRHVVCMANGTLALMVAAKSLDLSGQVIMPAFTFVATAQAMTWAGLEPRFCDVDPFTHNISVSQAERCLNTDTSAILGVHLWGRSAYSDQLQEWANANGLRLFFDAAHALGCSHQGKMIGRFGEIEVFSMHATKVLNAAEGGFTATNDAILADKMKTIRNFHESQSFAKVPLRINAKMSEAQAAMGLLNLEALPQNIEHNSELYSAYSQRISKMSGLTQIKYCENERTNFQYLIVEVDEVKAGLSRDDLVQLLSAEGVLARRYFTPGLHRVPPYCHINPQEIDSYPISDHLGRRLLQLPVGQAIKLSDVDLICQFLEFCLEHSQSIKKYLIQDDILEKQKKSS